MNSNDESRGLIKNEEKAEEKEELYKEFTNKIFSSERRNAHNLTDLQDKLSKQLKLDNLDVSLSEKIIEYISKLTVKREMIENELKKFTFKQRLSLKSHFVSKNTVSQIEDVIYY
jgi:hypothetical protein